MGMLTESNEMHLYCRKVLIKEKCTELLPAYLRFVKGVVDCEDLPLNISRETYQDSALISKLRNVVTRRVLKLLEDEMKRDPARYDQWFEQFNQFLKEGLMMDTENKDALLKLMRYHSTSQEGNLLVNLDEYVKKMKPGQSKIYFITSSSKEAALGNIFMEPFKNNADAPPVLILTNNVDEICFQQIGDYKSHRFANVETSYDEIQRELKINFDQAPADGTASLPEEDVTGFSLWLKNEL
jgi:TNF receptor-associated protein 1